MKEQSKALYIGVALIVLVLGVIFLGDGRTPIGEALEYTIRDRDEGRIQMEFFGYPFEEGSTDVFYSNDIVHTNITLKADSKISDLKFRTFCGDIERVKIFDENVELEKYKGEEFANSPDYEEEIVLDVEPFKTRMVTVKINSNDKKRYCIKYDKDKVSCSDEVGVIRTESEQFFSSFHRIPFPMSSKFPITLQKFSSPWPTVNLEIEKYDGKECSFVEVINKSVDNLLTDKVVEVVFKPRDVQLGEILAINGSGEGFGVAKYTFVSNEKISIGNSKVSASKDFSYGYDIDAPRNVESLSLMARPKNPFIVEVSSDFMNWKKFIFKLTEGEFDMSKLMDVPNKIDLTKVEVKDKKIKIGSKEISVEFINDEKFVYVGKINDRDVLVYNKNGKYNGRLNSDKDGSFEDETDFTSNTIIPLIKYQVRDMTDKKLELAVAGTAEYSASSYKNGTIHYFTQSYSFYKNDGYLYFDLNKDGDVLDINEGPYTLNDEFELDGILFKIEKIKPLELLRSNYAVRINNPVLHTRLTENIYYKPRTYLGKVVKKSLPKPPDVFSGDSEFPMEPSLNEDKEVVVPKSENKFSLTHNPNMLGQRLILVDKDNFKNENQKVTIDYKIQNRPYQIITTIDHVSYVPLPSSVESFSITTESRTVEVYHQIQVYKEEEEFNLNVAWSLLPFDADLYVGNPPRLNSKYSPAEIKDIREVKLSLFLENKYKDELEFNCKIEEGDRKVEKKINIPTERTQTVDIDMDLSDGLNEFKTTCVTSQGTVVDYDYIDMSASLPYTVKLKPLKKQYAKGSSILLDLEILPKLLPAMDGLFNIKVLKGAEKLLDENVKSLNIPHRFQKSVPLLVNGDYNIEFSFKDSITNYETKESATFKVVESLEDFDKDGILDFEDDDFDNDGLANSLDKLKGNVSYMRTNINGISLREQVSGSLKDVIQGAFNNERTLKIFNDKNDTIVEFKFNFKDKVLDMQAVTVERQDVKENAGEILVNIPDAVGTKTVWIENKNSNINTVCVDKTEIATRSVSKSCTGQNRVFLICNGEEEDGISCEEDGDYFKITGLKHSYVREQKNITGRGYTGASSGSGDFNYKITTRDIGPIDGKSVTLTMNKLDRIRFGYEGKYQIITPRLLYDSHRDFIYVSPANAQVLLKMNTNQPIDLNNNGKADYTVTLLSVYREINPKLKNITVKFEPIDQAPKVIETCSDGKKNQNETGIDCGGNCPTECPGDQILPPSDKDNDGVEDDNDRCPNTAAGKNVDSLGCEVRSLDSDNDGVPDSRDTCSGTLIGETVDSSGCAQNQLDSDGDGVKNNRDSCPNQFGSGLDGCKKVEPVIEQPKPDKKQNNVVMILLITMFVLVLLILVVFVAKKHSSKPKQVLEIKPIEDSISEFIGKERKRGMSDSDIKEQLKDVGWSQKDIDNHFKK